MLSNANALDGLRRPVTELTQLAGREEQLTALADAFAAPQGGLNLVLGGPKCGKTSLLASVEQALWARLRGESVPGLWQRIPPTIPIPLALDGIGSGPELLGDLVRTFRRRAREELGVCQVDDEELGWRIERFVESGRLRFFNQAWAMVYSVVEAAHRGLRVCWLLDDAEALLALPWQAEFLGTAATLLKPYAPSSLAGELCAVFSGGAGLYRAFYGEESAWSGEANEILLRAWNQPETDAALTAALARVAPDRPELPPDVRAGLWAESGGHPGLLCGELLPRLLAEEDPSPERLAARLPALAQEVGQADFWAEWFGLLTEPEQQFVWALLGSEEPLRLLDVRRAQPQLGKDPLALQQALKLLQFSGLIQAEGRRFRSGPALWARWYRANAPRPELPAADVPEFALRVRPGREGYAVEVASQAGVLRDDSERFFPLSQAELDRFLEAANRMAEGLGGQDEALLAEFGAALYDGFLSGTARRLFDQTWGLGAGEGQVNFRLALDDPFLAALPWELLLRADEAGETFLALSNRRPFVRDVALPEPAPPPSFASPLHILAVLSNPEGDLDLDGEEEMLDEALEEAQDDGRVTLSFLRDPTPVALNRAVLRLEPQILHFSGHGNFDPDAGEGFVLIERDGGPFPLTGTDLAEILDGSGVQLVVLDACRTGAGGRDHPGLGLGPTLIRRGLLPGVIGMQFAIRDAAAQVFSREFYTALLAGETTIEQALARARVRLAQEFGKGDIAWATPALWMRARSGRVG